MGVTEPDGFGGGTGGVDEYCVGAGGGAGLLAYAGVEEYDIMNASVRRHYYLYVQ